MKDEEVVAEVIENFKRQGIDVEGRVINSAVVRHASEFYCLDAAARSAALPAHRRSGLCPRGDYTRQSHICSMEGAVVSGQKAVESLV